MSQNKLYKFPTIDKLTAFLNGAVFGNNLQTTIGSGGGGTQAPGLGPGVGGLVGTTLTLIGAGPTGSVLFAKSSGAGGSASAPNQNPDPNFLLLKDIKLQIENAIAGVTVSMASGVVQIIESTPTDGITIAAGSAGGYPTVVGTVDLNGFTYGSGGSLDTLVLNVKHTGGSTLTTTFAAPANRGAIITQINANTVAGGITASINGANQLVLTASDQGSAVNIQVLAGTANTVLGLATATTSGAAANQANTLLGFDGSNNTVGKLFSPVEVSNSAPCWIWSDTDNNGSLVVFTWE